MVIATSHTTMHGSMNVKFNLHISHKFCTIKFEVHYVRGVSVWLKKKPTFRGPDPVEPNYPDDGGTTENLAFSHTNMQLITKTIYR